MNRPLFSITCTTCQAQLAVRDEALIGAILPCPKCGSLVQVNPPAGWGMPSEPEPRAETTAESCAPDANSPVSEAAAPAGPPPLPANPIAGAEHPPVPLEADPAMPGGLWASPTEVLWRRRLLAVVLAVGGMVVVAGLGVSLFSGKSPEQPHDKTASEPFPLEPLAVETVPEPAPARLDRRWMPDETTLLVRLDLPEPGGATGLEALVAETAPVWQPALAPVLKSFGVRLDSLCRLQLAATDLTAPAESCVVLIELRGGHDARVFREMGQAYDEITIDGEPCRRMPEAAWSHPYAVLDEHTLVTAPAELLHHVAGRSEIRLSSTPIARLTEAMRPEANFMFLVDLEAARQAAWRLPTALFDVWPTGRASWRALWETPQGLGLSLRLSEGGPCRLGLVCADAPTAEKVHGAMETLVSAAQTALASFGKEPGADAAAKRFRGVLQGTRVAIRGARCDTADAVAWLQLDWGPNPFPLAVAALESRPTILAAWLAAARTADEETQQRLMAALADYQRAVGYFPEGVNGGSLLNPETRLSWIASMLPYLDRAEWYKRLDPGYSWNGAHNAPVTGQLLPEVTNPALGPGKSEAGFPVTHYVGVAGVGADAARLSKKDRRAGVFGFHRRTAPADIPDGASNTLAVLGVSGRLGAWASGGEPTVRPLTQAPYVNGPDGFGSGQPDGMVAGMADGSVRFLSKEIDPRVMEQLATTHGREHIDLASLNPGATATTTPPSSELNEPAKPKLETKPADEPLAADPASEALRRRLSEPLPRFETRGQPLSAVVVLLGTLGGFQATLDEATLAKAGVSADEPVMVELTDTTLGEALAAVLAERGLRYAVRSGRVVIVQK